MLMTLHTSPFHRCIAWEGFAGGCRPWRGGWGSDDNDNNPREDDDVDDVRLCPPRPHNNNLLDKEKSGLSDEEKWGSGYCGCESSRAGQ